MRSGIRLAKCNLNIALVALVASLNNLHTCTIYQSAYTLLYIHTVDDILYSIVCNKYMYSTYTILNVAFTFSSFKLLTANCTLVIMHTSNKRQSEGLWYLHSTYLSIFLPSACNHFPQGQNRTCQNAPLSLSSELQSTRPLVTHCLACSESE